MKSLVFTLVLSLATGSPVLLDTPEVAAEKAKFALAFKAAEMGEHAKLAPVNNDIQEPAPVFAGAQIPEFFLADIAPVAEARAAFDYAYMAADMGEHAKLAPVNNAVQEPAPIFTGTQIPESFIADIAPVAEARAAFTAAFAAADLGEHAKLAPVNLDVQEPAPVFSGAQIPEAFLADLAPVAEARAAFTAAFDIAAAGGLATKQVPAPEFSGIQVPTAYLADTMEVADAKTTFMAAFDDAAAGGLAAKQAPAPAVPEPVSAVKSAAVVPAVVAPAVAAPVLYAHHYPYTYHTGLTYSGLPTVPYTSLPYHSFQPLTYTHTLPYAGFLPFPVVKPTAVAESVEEAVAIETE